MKTIIIDICDKELEATFLSLILTRARETNLNVSMHNDDNVGIITTCVNPIEPIDMPVEPPANVLTPGVDAMTEPVPPPEPIELNVSIPTLIPTVEPTQAFPPNEVSTDSSAPAPVMPEPAPEINPVPAPTSGECVIYSFSSSCKIPYSLDISLPCSILEVPSFTVGPELVDIIYCGIEVKYPLFMGVAIPSELNSIEGKPEQRPCVLIVVQRDNEPNTVVELAVELKLSADGKERLIFNGYGTSYD